MGLYLCELCGLTLHAENHTNKRIGMLARWEMKPSFIPVATSASRTQIAQGTHARDLRSLAIHPTPFRMFSAFRLIRQIEELVERAILSSSATRIYLTPNEPKFEWRSIESGSGFAVDEHPVTKRTQDRTAARDGGFHQTRGRMTDFAGQACGDFAVPNGPGVLAGQDSARNPG